MEDKIMNILIVIDEENIIQQINGFDQLGNPKVVGTKTNPIDLESVGTGEQFIFVIAKGDYLINNQDQSVLNINMNLNDIIVWRAVTLSFGDSYNAILRNNYYTPSDHLINHEKSETKITVYKPLDVNKPDGELTPLEIHDNNKIISVFIKQVLQDIRVTIRFRLVDRDGKIIGWYRWGLLLAIK